ncbi:MAG: VWA domain-containing protein [Terriglobales bacterium]
MLALFWTAPVWAQGTGSQQQAQQQAKKKKQAAAPPTAPVQVAPGSASVVPGGVTPKQLPPPSSPANPPASGAAKPGASPQVPEITANVNLVLVPVVVTDPLNRMVTGLEKQFFSLTEDKVAQTIKSFSTEDAPISVGVVFDSSGSMSNKIQESREALLQFFQTANPQDQFFLIDFADEPRLLCSFTDNIDKVEDAVTFLQAGGRTALLDAVYMALAQMRYAKYQRRALLIISDGGDNHSRYSLGDVLRVVREANVQIYGIGLFNPVGDRPTEAEVNGPALLDKITESTGGKTFEINDPDELADTATKIGIELRNEYVLGYTSTNQSEKGLWRKIVVKLHPPPGLPALTVSSRAGYYGPHP